MAKPGSANTASRRRIPSNIPTFHEHEGTIWLTVTQSDHDGTTDRIMFGKLETSASSSRKPARNASHGPHRRRQSPPS